MSSILKDYFGLPEVEILNDCKVNSESLNNTKTISTIQELTKQSPDKAYKINLNIKVLDFTTNDLEYNYLIHENTGYHCFLKCNNEYKLKVDETYSLEITGTYTTKSPKTPMSPWTHYIEAETVKIGSYPNEIVVPGEIAISPVKINKVLESKAFGYSVDVIGYAKIGNEKRVKCKNGDDKNKRDCVLHDESGQIYVTIWGDFDKTIAPTTIVAIKAAKISDYNGVTLNLTLKPDSILFNPVHFRTNELREWSQNKENSTIINNKLNYFQSNKQKSTYTQCKTVLEIIDILISEKLKEKHFGLEEIKEISKDPESKKAKYFSFYGYVHSVSMNQQFYYSACIRCNKKVTKQVNKEGSLGGTSLSMANNKNLNSAYFCYSCQKFYTKANKTYSLSCIISDGTDLIPVYFYSEKAQEMLNIPVETIATLKDKEDFDFIESEFQKAVYFKHFKFKIVAKPNNQILYDLDAVKERNRKLRGIGSFREKIKEAFSFQAIGVEKLNWNEYIKTKIFSINAKKKMILNKIK